MAEQTGLFLANLRMRDSLGQQALRDSITGLYNRRFADETVGREVARARRQDSNLGVLIADLDHSERFNDVHGHAAGDAILGAISGAILDVIRGEHVACRYGGEEFLLLMSDVDAETLLSRAELIRTAVASTNVNHLGSPLPPATISVGAALILIHGEHFIDVLSAADAALFSAKQRSRNRVILAPFDPTTQPNAVA